VKALLGPAALLSALAIPTAAQDLPELKAKGVLRVLAVPIEDGPQFISTRPGAPPGFDHELLDGLGRLEQLRLEVVIVKSWADLIPQLLEGKGDLIAGGFTATASRRRQIDFTIEAFPTRAAVMTRKPHRVIHGVDELRSEHVGTIRGTSMAEALAGLGVPAANIDSSIPPGGLAAALRAGQVSAAVDGIESALLAARSDPTIQVGMFVGPPESLAYGVRKTSPKLLASVNSYLGNVRKTATWSRLVVKYFGESAPEILKGARATEPPG
jgi:membrane-bound lytic murein transglycosylase F